MLSRIVALDTRRPGSVDANQKREMAMKHLKLIAAALVVLALSACVGFIVPIPLSSSTSTQDTSSSTSTQDKDSNQRR